VTTRPTAKAPGQTGLSVATRATYVAFVGCGFAFASWASRIPQVRDRLDLSSADLGLVLLTIAAGSIMALLLAGVIVSRFHSRRTVTAMAALQGAALAAVALGYLAGVAPVVVGLFVFGFSAAAWDVAMNVQGRRRTPDRPRNHAPVPHRADPAADPGPPSNLRRRSRRV
jgi:predicted MFS family arabinose efflux permease